MLTKESFLSVGLSPTMEVDDMARDSLSPPMTPTPQVASSTNINTNESCIKDTVHAEFVTPNPQVDSTTNINTNESYIKDTLLLPVHDEFVTPNPQIDSSTIINTIESCIKDTLLPVHDEFVTPNPQIDSSTIINTIESCIKDTLLLPVHDEFVTPNPQVDSSTNTNTNESCIKDTLLLPVHDEFVIGKLTPPLPPNTLPKPSEFPDVVVTSQSLNSTKLSQVDLNDEESCTEQHSSENLTSLQLVKRIEESSYSSSSLISPSQSIAQEDIVPSKEAYSIAKDDGPVICAKYYDNLPEQKEEVHSTQNKEQISTTDLTEKLNKLQISPENNQVKVNEETSIDHDKPPKKRASSLKLTKTPPDQKQNKIVKFADVFGLDIADVREFMKGIPDIPKSAFSDLTGTQVDIPKIMPKKCLSTHFKDPCDLPDFWERVLKQKVCVERVMVGDDMSVRGVIRVLNLAFDKKVFIKYTFDKWKTHHEATATYLAASNDGVTDQFSFLLYGNFLKDKGSLVFVVRYETLGQEYWDNNKGQNYKLHCIESLPGTPHSSTTSLEKSEKRKNSLPRVSRHANIHKPDSRQSLINSLNYDDLDDLLQKEELILNNKEPDLLQKKGTITTPTESAAIPIPNAEIGKNAMKLFMLSSKETFAKVLKEHIYKKEDIYVKPSMLDTMITHSAPFKEEKAKQVTDKYADELCKGIKSRLEYTDMTQSDVPYTESPIEGIFSTYTRVGHNIVASTVDHLVALRVAAHGPVERAKQVADKYADELCKGIKSRLEYTDDSV